MYNAYGRLYERHLSSQSTIWLFIPVLKLRDMVTEQTETYDFSETFLKEKWGTLTEIQARKDRFDIEFSIDGGTQGKGYVLLSDRKWYPVE